MNLNDYKLSKAYQLDVHQSLPKVAVLNKEHTPQPIANITILNTLFDSSCKVPFTNKSTVSSEKLKRPLEIDESVVKPGKQIRLENPTKQEEIFIIQNATLEEEKVEKNLTQQEPIIIEQFEAISVQNETITCVKETNEEKVEEKAQNKLMALFVSFQNKFLLIDSIFNAIL
jgi:hypothetical protein